MEEFAKGYTCGNCDVMALALHRLTGYSLGAWTGLYKDQDGEEQREYCHAVVILNNEETKYADVYGIASDEPRCCFNHNVESVALLPVDESDVRSMFTAEDISEEAIETAMEFAKIWRCTKDLAGSNKG
jgi:hypothetical protein